ncbi:MAG TPA: helix-turn-helix domain-containing protein [Sedimentibacter sp.]|nr:helix-turn-helix domain-containing protein [Sedimentibacter sp.]
MTIGDKILELRQKRKLTQQDLAESLNVTNIAISRWETGKTLPDVAMIKRISDSFGVPVSELYDCIDETKTNNYDKYDFEKIWKYKKYTIISCIFLILALLIHIYRIYFTYGAYPGGIFDSINNFYILVYGLSASILPILAVSFEIVHVVHLFSYSRTKYYKKEYNKTLITYSCIFILCFVAYLVCRIVVREV